MEVVPQAAREVAEGVRVARLVEATELVVENTSMDTPMGTLWKPQSKKLVLTGWARLGLGLVKHTQQID